MDGVAHCAGVFFPYAIKGAELPVNTGVRHILCPVYSGQTELAISVYSSSLLIRPNYVMDAGVVHEDTFVINISDGLALGKGRLVEITMFFGKSAIEVDGRRTNFGDTMKVENFSVKLKD